MKSRKYGMLQPVLAAMLVMMLLLIAACGSNGNESGVELVGTPAPSAPTETAQSSEEPGKTQYPLTVTDDTGVAITLEQAPAAVVSLAPSETETLFAIGAGDQVVGVDEFSNYPEEASTKAKVGDMTTNIEAVMALNPDLVIASSSANFAAVEELRKLNVPVFAVDPLTYDAVVAKIETIGTIMDRQAAAAEVASEMLAVKAKVVESVKNETARKVYLEFSEGWTVGSGTFLDELVTLAGGINIAGSQQGWYEVNEEQVIIENPAFIIYPDWGVNPHPIAVAIESRPGWDVIEAVANGSLHAVTEDPLVRVGPRLADGLLELAKIIHPDSFK